MFELQPERFLNVRDGIVAHNSIHGKSAFHVAVSHMGAKLTIRRPTLEEYVLLMKRVATPAYPKEIWTMLGLLDIGPGSVVLEAGSGSGSLTLFLSRAGTFSSYSTLQPWPTTNGRKIEAVVCITNECAGA